MTVFVRGRAISLILTAFAGIVPGKDGHAQLRPYEPFEWPVFDRSAPATAMLGTAYLAGQRASLAGTTGDLLELGSFQAFFRSGPIALEAGGTPYRFLREDEAFAEPTGGAHSQAIGTRHDVGDFRVATTLLLTPEDSPAAAILRFGTRLPTTNNRVGLERDATDFFALIGARLDHRALRVTSELGLGIHGTRLPNFEQSDVLLYLLGLTIRGEAVEPSVHVVGQADALDWVIRGNEKLSELRFRIRTRGSTWLQVEAIRGLARFSPAYGVTFAVGTAR